MTQVYKEIKGWMIYGNLIFENVSIYLGSIPIMPGDKDYRKKSNILIV